MKKNYIMKVIKNDGKNNLFIIFFFIFLFIREFYDVGLKEEDIKKVQSYKTITDLYVK